MKEHRRYFSSKLLFFIPIIMTLFILLCPIPAMAQESDNGLIINLTSGYYDTEIAAGESKIVYFELTNKSDIATTGIEFSYNAPEGWLVEFNPENIEILESDNYEVIEVTVTAPVKVEKGTYSINIITDSSAGRRIISTYFRVEKGTSIWAWVGGALGVIVIISFIFVYRRFARD